MNDNMSAAKQRLENLRTTQLKNELTKGWLSLFAGVVGLWCIALVVESIFRLPEAGRIASLTVIGISGVIGFLFFWHAIRIKKYLSKSIEADEYWALRLGEKTDPAARDRLLNAIQINTQSRRDITFSTDLKQAALYSAVSKIEHIPVSEVIDLTKYQRYNLRIVSLTASVLLLSLIVPLTSISDGRYRLLHPGTDFSVQSTLLLKVSHADGWAYRGEPTDVTITAEGENLTTVELLYSYDGGQWQTEKIPLTANSGNYRFEGLSSSIDYYARYKQSASPHNRLDIVARPQVAELQYKLTPPAYTGLKPELGAENIGDVEALPGSRFELNIRANKRLSSGWMVFHRNGTDSLSLDSIGFDIAGQTGSLKTNLATSGTYQIRLQDEDKHTDKDPVSYRVQMLVDEYPVVSITYPDQDVVIGEDMSLPLEIDAADDFGIRKLELAYMMLNTEQDTNITTFPISLAAINEKIVVSQSVWDLSDLILMPGDVIEYWAQVWDNDNVSGPKLAVSEHRLLRLPTIEEIVEGVDQTEQSGFDQAEKSLESAKDLQEHMQEIIEEMKRNPNMNWEKQKEVEAALEQQADVQKQVEELQKRVDELVEQLEKHDLASMETMEKYMQLQQLLEEIATPELKEAMDKIRKAMEEQDPQAMQKALNEFDLNREEFLISIERSLSILKQLQLERKMDELVKQAEEILHAQENILDKLENDETADLAKRQELNSTATERLEKNMEEVQKLSSETEDNALSQELSGISESFEQKDVPGSMQQAAANISQGNKQSARQKGEQSARELSQLASQLNSAAQEMKERRKQELQQKLRRITEELLYVSEFQEGLSEESKRTGTHSPRYRGLASLQSDIRGALNGVIGKLFDVSKETFFVTPQLGAALGRASEKMGEALAKYSDRNPRSVDQSQQDALGQVNRAAQQLLSIMDQMQGSESSTGYEEMMEQLSQMAQQQQGLNQQSMPMPGGSEGQMPMPGGQSPNGQQMARMAAEQRALQQQMEELSGQGQGMQEILGDLDGIAKAMAEVAGDMEKDNVNERTRRLQQQIVSRLLDATRSAREQEYSQKRESKTGQEIVRRSPAKLQFDADKEKLRRDLLKALQEGYTNDYKTLIRAYFRELENSGIEANQ